MWYVADERLTKHIADVEAAFPSYEIGIEDLVAEGDKVVRGEFHESRSGLVFRYTGPFTIGAQPCAEEPYIFVVSFRSSAGLLESQTPRL